MLATSPAAACALQVDDEPSIQDLQTAINDLSTSCFSPLLLWLYRVLNCQRRWRVARVLLHVAQRLEGGPMKSATSRRMMSQFHGVVVGAHSYGDCFDPAVIPPGIVIGRYVSIARGVRFFNQNHPLDQFSTHPYFYETCPGVAATNNMPRGQLEIGHDVWIGCNAIVTPGCRRIGTGAVIGAGAIVTKDVPDFTIVAGNPARRIRDRFSPELIEKLRRIAWWQWPATEVLARRDELVELIGSKSGV